MNGLWFIVFGLTALMIITGVGAIIFGCKSNKYAHAHKVAWEERTGFTKSDDEIRFERLANIHENLSIGFGVPSVISAICWVIFLLCAIFCPVSAKKEVAYFKHQKSYVESAVTNGSDLENIAITQVIIDQNEWLAHAKSRLDAWGRFSKYYGSGLEEVTPIIIER